MRFPKESILVNEIMRTPVVEAKPSDDIFSIARKMRQKNAAQRTLSWAPEYASNKMT